METARPMTRFEHVLEAVVQYPPKRIAVAAAHDETVLAAVKEACDRGMGEPPLLVGRKEEILRLAQQVGLDLSEAEVIDESEEAVAAHTAARLVAQGRAEVLMKGLLHTDDFLRGVLDKDHGLRAGVVMSHVFVLELVHEERLLLITDAAMNIAPDVVQKAEIILNAIYLANLLGMDEPKVATLAAVEVVNPKMPATLDAGALAKMADRHQFSHGLIDGPFGMDNAVSVIAAQHKKIAGPVAGRADILLVPDIEAGNIMVKTFVYLGGGRIAGVLMGASAPVVLTSRADSAESKLHSIALAVLMADLRRNRRLKLGKVHY